MNYNIDYFIEKFEAIPEGQWITDEFTDPDTGSCCALGHCGVRADYNGVSAIDTPESKALEELFTGFRNEIFVAAINDGQDPEFQQPTPKQRILAALNFIKGNPNE